MDRSPVPRYDLLHLPDYMCMSLQTSRGCPHDCEFCDVVTLFGRRVRHKSPDQVLGELETLYRLGWQGEIFIADDNLIGHRGHARGLLRKLDGWMAARGEPYSFWCQASLELGDDPEMIDLMTQVQVDHVFVGVESPDKAVLQKANKQQNLEHDPAVMLGNLRDGGLTVTASLMVGCDGEEPGVDRRITALVEETAVPLVMINRVVALPGTRLWQRLEAEGRLAPDPRYAQQTGLARRVVPQRDPDQVEAEYLRLWEHLYDPPRFLARNFHYHLAMRPTRAALAQAAGRRPPQPPGAATGYGPGWRISVSSLGSCGAREWPRRAAAPVLVAAQNHAPPQPHPRSSLSQHLRLGRRFIPGAAGGAGRTALNAGPGPVRRAGTRARRLPIGTSP